MCLAVPSLVKSIKGQEAQVEMGGVTRKVSIALTPEIKVGDYVLVHSGYAIGAMDENEAHETFDLLGQMEESLE